MHSLELFLKQKPLRVVQYLSIYMYLIRIHVRMFVFTVSVAPRLYVTLLDVAFLSFVALFFLASVKP